MSGDPIMDGINPLELRRAWDCAIAEAASEYVTARLAMSDAPGSTETAIARLDDAWRVLVDCYDQENPA